MANIQSSKKDIRRTIKRRERNSQQKARLRTYDKKVRKLLEEGNVQEAEKEYAVYTSYLDRAGKTRLIHPGAADRKKSRLAMLLNKAGGDAAAPAVATAKETAPATEQATTTESSQSTETSAE